MSLRFVDGHTQVDYASLAEPWDPVMRPSARTRGLLARAEGEARMRRALLLTALVAVLIAFFATLGCCSNEARAVHVVREARALLRHPTPGDAEWESRRAIFLEDAELVAPSDAPTARVKGD